MKKATQIICTVAVMALMASCGKSNEYSINGSIADEQFNGHQAYLYNGTEVVDSALITDGKFTMTGKVAEPWIGTIYAMGESSRAQLGFVVEAGEIELDVLYDHLGGTPLNDSLQAFIVSNDYSDLEPELRSYEQLYYSAPNAEVRRQAEQLYDSVEAIATSRTFERAMAFYKTNSDNILGAYAMAIICETDLMTYSQLEEMLEDAPAMVKDYAPVSAKLNQLNAVEQTSVGKRYTDIQGVDGKLSDLVDGHIALVDFWASWCGPCRAEIKDNLVPLWAKYKDKGLVIVGLNVWERGDAEKRAADHQKAMENLGITYPQLVDSTRTATDTYGVRGIPQILLIGADGTILARDLRGAAIEEAIVKALGK